MIDHDDATLDRVERQPDAPWPAGLEGERHAQIVAGNFGSDTGFQAWLQSIDLDGSGVVVAIPDTGIDINLHNNIAGHPDLRGRQVAFFDYSDGEDPVDRDGHGTLVGSIAVGNAATGERQDGDPEGSLLGQGMAPAATFVNQNVLKSDTWPPDFQRMTREAVEHGARVMNMSWNDRGLPGAGYGDNAALFDRLVRCPSGSADEPATLTIVSSAGNRGPSAKSIMPPKEAKNLIVVGGSARRFASPDTPGELLSRSSRGPARDGRYLPTLVAPGAGITGARPKHAGDPISPSGLYQSMSDTSFAAPFVTGCCALLIQWWWRQHGGDDPSPAMLKALLINGADDLRVGGPGETGSATRIPNNHQGWGHVNLRNILETVPESAGARRGPRLCLDREAPFLAGSDSFLFEIRPHDTSRPLRITLVWTDAPGVPGADPALVNNLDLEVIELTTRSQFKGNDFVDGFTVADSGREFDRINNVECVYIERPVGPYAVRVIPASVTGNARPPFTGEAWQDFALVLDNAVTAR